MKKGFTLIELLGVIVILSILAILLIPVIDNNIKSAKQKLYDAQLSNIKESAQIWVTDHIKNLPTKDGESIVILLGQLKKEGYVDPDIKNPKTEMLFSNNSLIMITREKDNFVFTLNMSDTENPDETVDVLAPMISLNGNMTERILVGQPYKEPGYVARTYDGTIIQSVTAVIRKGTTVVTSIPNNVVGTYTITYTVTDRGLSTSITRTIEYVSSL